MRRMQIAQPLLKQLIFFILISLTLFQQFPCFSLMEEDHRPRQIEFSQTPRRIVSSGPAITDQTDFPQRIISLGPSITEELYLLGVEDRILGTTVYCKRPPEAQNKEKVGTAMGVNLEKIISLEPDLVLATTLTDTKAAAKLKSLGIEVAVFPSAKNFDEICDQFLELGRLVGKENQAHEIVNRAKTKVELIKKRVEGLPRQKVFVQLGARPLHAATEDFFVNDFIEFAGGINIASASKGTLYSRERVLQDNPDVIIITTMGMVGEEERGIWKRFENLEAARNDRIYIVDSYKFCSPTPVSFVETLEEIVEILYPKDG